jgi:hypothetical protein
MVFRTIKSKFAIRIAYITPIFRIETPALKLFSPRLIFAGAPDPTLTNRSTGLPPALALV